MYTLDKLNDLTPEITVSKEGNSTLKASQFIIKIKCDENDADYRTKVTTLVIGSDIKESILPEFIRAMYAIKELALIKGYVNDAYETLSETCKRYLYEFENAYDVVEEYDCFSESFEEYHFLSSASDSLLIELFPKSYYGYDIGVGINGCHSIVSFNIEFIDCNGVTHKLKLDGVK
jgi:hypothetical protein